MGDFLGLFRGFLGNFGGLLVLNFFIISANFSAGFGVSGGGGFLVDFVTKFSSNFDFEIFLPIYCLISNMSFYFFVDFFNTPVGVL